MFASVMGVIFPLVEVFARAGGGGSSSGGSGDSFIVVIGYVPMHALGAWSRRIGKKRPTAFVALGVVSGVIALVYAVILIALFRWFLGGIAASAALIGVCAGLFGWFGKLKRSKQTEAALGAAAAQDGAWSEERLLPMAQEVFMRYQADWSSGNAEAMRAYCTPTYYYHSALLLAALGQLHRINRVDAPVIEQMMVVDFVDAAGTDGDSVVIGITAHANDQLIDAPTGQLLNAETAPFTEFWRFIRQGSQWLLDGIQQATEAQWTHKPTLEQFAQQNGMYFSLDMGRLLVPKRGVLFDPVSLKTADINNHVIGLYAQKYLVQLYTFSALPMANTTGVYLIAQIMVPKEYGDIVVRRKSGNWMTRAIGSDQSTRGLKKITMEWGDFNRKYDVYASSTEGVTSFELLNPSFMEQLEAAPFEVNIEVVDNIVYFYAKEAGRIVPDSYYDDLLKIVYEAYRQMRM